MIRHALTTDDNPFDPFDQFTEWYEWDVDNGYNTSSYLARILNTSDELPEKIQQDNIMTAIQEILEDNGDDNNYVVVSREDAA